MSNYPLTETLRSLLGDLYGSGINAMAHCPLHEDRTPSLSIHQGEGMWLCHQCGARGGLDRLAAIVGEELSPEIRWDMAIRSVRDVPPVERNFSAVANRLYEQGMEDSRGDRVIRDFLHRRHISLDARHHFSLGWDGRRISFPYWEDDARKRGTCVGIKYRDGQSGAKSYEDGSKRAVYNVEEIRGAGKVVICEGESDTLLAWSQLTGTDIRVAGIPGASISESQWEIFALDFLFASKIYMAFDADEAGDRGAEKCAKILGERVIRVRPDEGLDLSSHFEKHGRLPDGLEDQDVDAGRVG